MYDMSEVDSNGDLEKPVCLLKTCGVQLELIQTSKRNKIKWVQTIRITLRRTGDTHSIYNIFIGWAMWQWPVVN